QVDPGVARPLVPVADPGYGRSGKCECGRGAVVHGKNGRATAVKRAVIGVPGSGVGDGRAILLVASYGTACLGGGLRCVRVTGAASAVVRPHAVIVGGARR